MMRFPSLLHPAALLKVGEIGSERVSTARMELLMIGKIVMAMDSRTLERRAPDLM
jgi:hypothetical protein